MNHRQPEQLNNAQFPAESEPEYTLEEIMAEFGAPQEAVLDLLRGQGTPLFGEGDIPCR